MPRVSLPSGSIPVLASLLVTLAPVACGRTGLDAPVDVTGGAGRATGQAAVGGQAGAGGQPTAGAAGGAPGGCVEGTNNCADPRTGQICTGGVFKPFECPMGCFDGVCAECVPGTSTCISSKAVQICNGSGILQPPEPCDGSCVNGACIGCAEGATRCASHEAQQTCKGGQWTLAAACPFVCVGSACGKNVRHVFVTSETFVGGRLGGLAGADAACQKFAFVGKLAGIYHAWLSDSTGSPVSRFPEDVGPYVLVDGSIVANNWTDLTSGTLRHAIDVTELGGPPPLGTVGCVNPAVWSGTKNDGTLDEQKGDCGDWSSPTSEAVVFGSVESTTLWSDACTVISGTPAKACGGSSALYCFEQ